MTARLKAFGLFWYDFIIGDDWSVAAGVVIALVVTALLSRTSVAAWWILPVAVFVLLPLSLWRATRAERRRESTSSS
jgi:Sec-independent protein secretion pathway component TatC